MALFDVRSGKKISEDFHFDINYDSMTNLVNHDNQIDGHKFIEISKNCKVTKNWLFKQKQVIYLSYYVLYIFTQIDISRFIDK